MNPNDDEIRGKIDQAKGNVKERIGRATGNPDLEDEGAGERIGGNIEEGIGRARRKTGEALRDIGRKLNED
jgi:uncharacterized protein YjbJ (UPF0337 family)